MEPYRSVLGALSKIPGVSVYVEGITVSGSHATTLIYVSLPEKKRIHQTFMEELRRHPEVEDYRIMSKKRYSMIMAVTKSLCEFYEYTLSSGRFTFFPYVLKSGRRVFYMVSPENHSSVLSRLSMHGKVLSFEKVSFETAIRETSLLGLNIAAGEAITPSQRAILVEAIKRGYYEWPRKISLTELAREFGISKATLSEHLRRGEQKLLTLLLNSS